MKLKKKRSFRILMSAVAKLFKEPQRGSWTPPHHYDRVNTENKWFNLQMVVFKNIYHEYLREKNWSQKSHRLWVTLHHNFVTNNLKQYYCLNFKLRNPRKNSKNVQISNFQSVQSARFQKHTKMIAVLLIVSVGNRWRLKQKQFYLLRIIIFQS